MKEVILTHEGLSRLSSTRDFVLKTDDARVDIECSRSQISFVSPIVAKMLANDPTVDRFALKTKKSSRCSELMSSLLSGKRVTVTGDMISIFYSIALELGNEELFASIEEDLSLSNALDIVQTKYVNSLNIEQEIEFIASHFCELQNEIHNVDITIIESILESEHLVVKSEHDLFLFICDLISSNGDQYRILLSHLHLEYLDVEDVSFVLSFIDDNNIGSFLQSICHRLLCPIIAPKRETNKGKIVNVPYKSDSTEGIISYIYKDFLKDQSPSSINEFDPSKRRRLRLDFISLDFNNNIHLIDFKDKKVALTGFLFKIIPGTYVCTKDSISLKIEGSNDNLIWKIIQIYGIHVDSLLAKKRVVFPCKPSGAWSNSTRVLLALF